MAIPIPLILAGIAAGAQLAGAIGNAAGAGDRKRDWKKAQKAQIGQQALLAQSSRRRGGRGPNPELAAYFQAQGIDKAADENFKVDPMSFLPFVQSGANFAGQAYNYANAAPSAQTQQLQQDMSDRQQDAEALRFFRQNGWEGYGKALR